MTSKVVESELVSRRQVPTRSQLTQALHLDLGDARIVPEALLSALRLERGDLLLYR